MKFFKRTISVFLAALLVMSVIPIAISASDGGSEITEHVEIIEHYRPVHQWVYPWQTVDGDDSTIWYPEVPSGTDYASLTYEFDAECTFDEIRCLITGESGGTGRYNIYAYVNDAWETIASGISAQSGYKSVMCNEIRTSKIKIEVCAMSFRYSLGVREVEFYGTVGQGGGETHTHSYTVASVTPPTETTLGYTTYTCSCGLSYYGKYVKATGTVSRTLPDMDKFIGINGVMSDTAEQLSCATYYREYHTWLWTYSDGLTNFTRANNRYKNMDEYYASLKNAGMEIVPCLQQYGATNPVPSENVSAYLDYARHAYQYAAHYGRNSAVDISTVNFSSYDNATVGLGYINYLEIGNENNSNYTAQQYAAMLSAAYDGHCGTMGTGIGAKNADPNIKISMQGTAGIPMSYINDMISWCSINRADGSLPFDVFNVHNYFRKQINVTGSGYVNVGISPEEANIGGVMSEILALRDSQHPGKEVWLTEFGWDTNQTYTQYGQNAMAYGNYTGRQVQAMWLTRTYLILSSLGVDKAAMYMCKDSGPEATTVGMYGTCGVITSDGEYKDSYYYLSTLKNRMNGMKFVGEIDSGYSDLWIYKFADENGKICYALWCPTSDGTAYSDYSLSISGNNIKLVEMTNGQINGTETALSAVGGSVSVNVSECPVLVIADPQDS